MDQSRLVCILLSLFTWHGSAIAGEPPNGGVDTAAGPHQAVIGYLPWYHMGEFDPDATDFVTDVIYFAIEPTASGDLDTARTRPEHLQRLLTLRERQHFRLSVAIVGDGPGKNFPACALNPTARRHLVSELASYCRKNKLDGIDFDWEFPKGEAEEDAYAELIVECKHALEPEKGLVTAAVNARQRLRPDAVAALDRIHLMSYDNWGRHSTMDQARADVKALIGRGVPKEKIALGVPFYGRDLPDRNRRPEVTYADIVRLHHPAANVDEADGFYFNGVQTIEAKTRYAREAGLAGIMIWEITQDTHDSMSLLHAIHRAIQGR